MKIINLLTIIYLIVCSSYLTTSKKIMSSKAKADSVAAGKIAGTCLKALVESIPPSFCWKKGADVGVIPTNCPIGYFRSLALCYQHCRPNYKFVAGVCWEYCPGGTTDIGLFCVKSIFKWLNKGSYMSSSITNFSDKIPCPEGMYRSAALCYRDCNIIGMANCGIGACSADSASCGSEILSMVTDVISGAADAVMFVASAGGSSAATAAKSALKKGVKALGKKALQKSFNAVKKSLMGQFKDKIVQKAINSAKGMIKDVLKEKIQEAAIGVICKSAMESFINKGVKMTDINEDTVVSAVDVFNVSGMKSGCGDTSDGGINCASAIVSGLSNFDPTGLLTIAGAFIKPVCEVSVEAGRKLNADPLPNHQVAVVSDTATDDDGQTKSLASVSFDKTVLGSGEKDNCVYVYPKCEYKGKRFEYCSNSNYIGDEINDKVRSLKVGAKVNGAIFFRDWHYEGASFIVPGGESIKCLADPKDQKGEFISDFSSIRFNPSECVTLSGQYPEDKEADPIRYFNFCESVDALSSRIKISRLQNAKYQPKSGTFNKKIQFFEQRNFTGNSMTYQNEKVTGKIENIVSFKII